MCRTANVGMGTAERDHSFVIDRSSASQRYINATNSAKKQRMPFTRIHLSKELNPYDKDSMPHLSTATASNC